MNITIESTAKYAIEKNADGFYTVRRIVNGFYTGIIASNMAFIEEARKVAIGGFFAL